MLIKAPRGWELPESAATPESVFLNRRELMKGLAAGPILAAGGLAAGAVPFLTDDALAADPPDPSAKLYPAKKNETYKVDRAITDERAAASWNNFYEFLAQAGDITDRAARLQVRPWEVAIGGMVEKPRTVAIDELFAAMPFEERVYRHRCVETWSMTVPWTGFPVKALVNYCQPLGSAKFVVMKTLMNRDMFPTQRQFFAGYPWPYTEGLTIEEATHDLAFMVTGVYGKPAAKQHGAPLRLAVPWKYGFKSVKSIVEVTFTDQRPVTFWETLQPREYGFWANVNPAVDHPRWSQAEERPLGQSRRVPTLLYNGYAEYVAPLYAGMGNARTLFM
jgi:sulfoxide reductase catalytic subunit YedY